MNRFGIITNEEKDPEGELTAGICRYLDEKGAFYLTSKTGDDLPSDLDGVLVLGGDGTLLRAAKKVVGKKLPLLGINLGTLGYLAEVERGGIYSAIDRLLAGEYTIEQRMMLRGRILRGDEVFYEDIALNDIVLSRVQSPRMMTYQNYVNGAFLNSYMADGIIISTATGSTGYSLSAGGPIVSPSAELMIMTPLAPHTINTRSVVFPKEDTITVEVHQGRTKEVSSAQVSFDGSVHVMAEMGDRISVTCADCVTRIIKLSQESFLSVLRAKMRVV